MRIPEGGRARIPEGGRAHVPEGARAADAGGGGGPGPGGGRARVPEGDRTADAGGGGGRGPRLVGELCDPRMKELLLQRWPGTRSEFVLPRELNSAALVQYALAPEVRKAIDSPCECEHNNPDSLDARLFPSVVFAVAPALTMDKAASLLKDAYVLNGRSRIPVMQPQQCGH